MTVTVVTGASSGIGRSLAARLAAGGDPVAALARRADALDELVGEIETRGGRAIAVPCDVTNRAAVTAAFQRIETELGAVDRLVANAGGGEKTRVETFDAAHVAAALDLNVMGTVHCIEAVLPAMLQRGSGHLVAMSSLAASRGLPGAAAYSGSKAALTNLMESLRLDLRPYGIDVTVLLPGFIRTKPVRKNKPSKRKPFRLELEVATRRMERAIRKRRPRYAFPWPLALLAAIAAQMPAPLYDRLLTGRGRVTAPVRTDQ